MTHPIGPWEVVEEMSYSMRRQWFLRRDNKNTKWPFGQEPLLTPKHRKRLFLSPEKAKAHADKLNAAAGVTACRTPAEWWAQCRENPYWSGSIVGLAWAELWPEAQAQVTAIFDAARGVPGTAPARSHLCEHDCAEGTVGGPRCEGPCAVLGLHPMDEVAHGVPGLRGPNVNDAPTYPRPPAPPRPPGVLAVDPLRGVLTQSQARQELADGVAASVTLPTGDVLHAGKDYTAGVTGTPAPAVTIHLTRDPATGEVLACDPPGVPEARGETSSPNHGGVAGGGNG